MKAMEMIVAEGFDGLSMQKLAKAAGVSPATIYIYWKNREDLLNQLFQEVQENFTRGSIGRIFAGNEPVRRPLVAMAEPAAFHFGVSRTVRILRTIQALSFDQPRRHEICRLQGKHATIHRERSSKSGVTSDADRGILVHGLRSVLFVGTMQISRKIDAQRLF
jgi:AcrR family transcriptional regulator